MLEGSIARTNKGGRFYAESPLTSSAPIVSHSQTTLCECETQQRALAQISCSGYPRWSGPAAPLVACAIAAFLKRTKTTRAFTTSHASTPNPNV